MIANYWHMKQSEPTALISPHQCVGSGGLSHGSGCQSGSQRSRTVNSGLVHSHTAHHSASVSRCTLEDFSGGSSR